MKKLDRNRKRVEVTKAFMVIRLSQKMIKSQRDLAVPLPDFREVIENYLFL